MRWRWCQSYLPYAKSCITSPVSTINLHIWSTKRLSSAVVRVSLGLRTRTSQSESSRAVPLAREPYSQTSACGSTSSTFCFILCSITVSVIFPFFSVCKDTTFFWNGKIFLSGVDHGGYADAEQQHGGDHHPAHGAHGHFLAAQHQAPVAE